MHRRDDRGWDAEPGGAIGWPAHLARAGATIVRHRRWSPRIDPVVDLGEGICSARWCRGVATLGAMIAALLHVAPGLEPPPIGASHAVRTAPPTTVDQHAGPATSMAPPQATLVSAARRTTIDARPIGTDRGPIRLTGIVGGGLYRALRDAGAAPSVAADAIGAFATRIDIGTIASTDRFDIVLGSGPGGPGRLLYAGIVHDGQPLSLLRWTLDGREIWFDAAGTGAPDGGFTVPVADARLSSGFGMRFHPVLGFSRMHLGVDLAAPAGTPIVSAAEGIVRFAGEHGGYGNFVQVQHDGAIGTGYGHMSGIVVHPGAIVRQGELLGYVGSTGLSTGPHCHFEVYRDGVAIDPTTVKFSRAAQLGGAELQRFHATLARLTTLPITASSRT